MPNDRNLRQGDVLAAHTGWSALRPAFGVVERDLVAGIAEHRCAQTDSDARLVHHVEHATQTFVRLADKVADSPGATAVQTAALTTCAHRKLALAKIEQGVRNAAITELVVQARKRHIVALAGQFAVDIHQFFGHDEQRYAPGARNQLAVRPRNLGQHQMNDVFRQLVLAVGDPHLVAAQAVARAKRVALEIGAIGRGAGHHIRQARPGLGLAQAHRS